MSYQPRRFHTHRLFVFLCILGACAFFGPVAPVDADMIEALNVATWTASGKSLSVAPSMTVEPEEDDGEDARTEEAPPAEESSDEADPSDTVKDEDAADTAGQKTEPEESEESSPAQTSDEEKDKSNSPQVEVYIPSVTGLVEAYRKSRSARLAEAFAGMVPKFESETDDGFDIAALLSILERIASWPDTSMALTTYTQDREGRPRWAVRVDWPLDDLHARVQEILDDGSARKIFKDMSLRRDRAREASDSHDESEAAGESEADDHYVLEIPDMELAVLKRHGGGSMIAANADLLPPELLFGQKADGEDRSRARSGRGTLLYSRLNMEAGDEGEKRRSMLSGLGLNIFSDIRYAATVDAQGQWRERINIRWNPLIGLGLKTALKKAGRTFDVPKESYAAGVLNLAIGEGMADSLAGLDSGTIGGRAGGEMAFAVVPGEGFFPIPDVYYQLNVRRIDRIKKDIREAIAEDTEERKDDDRPPAWHEEEIAGKVVFWRDPSADQGGSFSFATFRTVLFFEPGDQSEEGSQDRLIIVSTSMQAEDVVRRWRDLRRKPGEWMCLPDSSNAHWQFVVNWKSAYELVQPYLSVFAATSEVGESAPRAEALADSLSASTIDLKIGFAGLDVRHIGPVPIGAAYVPGVTFASLSATADPGSEAARERLACRNLRVLHHHAQLFQKDYGRWPATVAELDGYVDFASHPHLLNIRPKDAGFVAGFVGMFTGDRRKAAREERDDDEIDDTLYEIDWDEDEWKLKFRENEFVHYVTIYIDHEGQIHRVPKPDAEATEDGPDTTESTENKKEMALR